MKINELYPDFLKNIDAEKASINELTKSYDEYLKRLSNTISIKVVEQKNGRNCLSIERSTR